MAKINAFFDGKPAASYLRSKDGMQQIIYGDSSQLHRGGRHGHVSFDPDSGSVDYWRTPDQAHSDYLVDSSKSDHTRI